MELITMNARGAQNTIGYRESLPATLPHSLSHVAGSALYSSTHKGASNFSIPPEISRRQRLRPAVPILRHKMYIYAYVCVCVCMYVCM